MWVELNRGKKKKPRVVERRGRGKRNHWKTQPGGGGGENAPKRFVNKNPRGENKDRGNFDKTKKGEKNVWDLPRRQRKGGKGTCQEKGDPQNHDWGQSWGWN